MIEVILFIIIGILIGCGIACLILIPKVKKTIKRNGAIAQENKELEELNFKLKHESDTIKHNTVNIKNEYESLSARRDEIKVSINDLQQQSEDAAQQIYQSAREAAQLSFDKEIEQMSDNLDKEREKVKNLYLNMAKECVLAFQQQIELKQQELEHLSIILAEEKRNVDAAVEVAKQRQEIANFTDYHRLSLTEEDTVEIHRLREVLPYLRDKTPLNKVIYKVYYEKPLTDMIGRVVGTGTHTGIYKITHIDSQKCYVGQAVNIAERWKQHCKRGVGAEDWTRNKLYPAMYNLGVENFTFEIIEECERSQLSKREDYWQDYFHAKDFGYSIK